MSQARFEAEVMDELKQQEEKQMKTISLALVNAQKQFAPALKTNTNPHFKSKYVGLDGCVEAVIDALNDNGIYLMQKNHPNDAGVAIETIFIHQSGETISGGILTVPASKQDAQGYGSALTYARRYSLMAACGIAPEDDDGNQAVRQQVKHLDVDAIIAKLQKATNKDELTTLYKIAIQEVGTNKEAHSRVVNASKEIAAKFTEQA